MKDTSVELTAGRRRCGKSHRLKKDLNKKKRLIVWDLTHEYGGDKAHSLPAGLGGMVVVNDRRELIKLLRVHRNKPLRVAYQPRSLKYFDWFCRIVAGWRNCAVLVEELASVTTPQKAPQGWGDLVRQSGHYEVDVYAVTQRPAEIDKTIFGNTSIKRCFKLERVEDVAYMARELRIDFSDLDGMPKYWYWERNSDEETVTLYNPAGKKVAVPPWRPAKPTKKTKKTA